ncbi:MAG: hypothetical protein RLZZ293_626 [Pseudomonadota bacterium]|jgi:hypothetical protein
MNTNLIPDTDLIQCLKNKQLIINQQIEEYKAKIIELDCSYNSIDSTIKYLSSESSLVKANRTYIFEPNECKILTLDYLRLVNETVTSRQIAKHLANKIGFNLDKEPVQFQNTIVKTLRKLEQKGLVKQVSENQKMLSV